MTNLLNRRAALGSIAAASAMLAAPAASALVTHPDADLLSLQGPIDAAYREFEAAFDVATVAEVKFFDLRPAKPAAPEMDLPSQEACAEFAKRMAEITANGPTPERVAYDEALRQREQEEARVRVDTGLEAAEAAKATTLATIVALEARIVDTPAKTLAGIIFKAKYASEHDFDPDVMASIVDDLLGMVGEV